LPVMPVVAFALWNALNKHNSRFILDPP